MNVSDNEATGQAGDERDERHDLIDRLTQLQRTLGRVLAHDRSTPLLASSLTMQQLKVVMMIFFRDASSGQHLARALGTGLGTVTGIVDRLVAQGLVTRREDPADRRVRLVELTTRGRLLAEELIDAGTSSYMCLLSRLDTETLHALEHVMTKLHAAADEMLAESRRSAH
ncbi:MarR family winged helix-turn-helix transcriptional regulator [Microtetraspora niveoalba]|uniref:MarR family winged helix-turn-helix transcriptional regulator n=1 Tax=Microtetraspora niveoalba TaxID=46175 RepID=UPI000AD524A8|nr:MarR family transcriptional regulator [Microtetraspora niveoalba]